MPFGTFTKLHLLQLVSKLTLNLGHLICSGRPLPKRDGGSLFGWYALGSVHHFIMLTRGYLLFVKYGKVLIRSVVFLVWYWHFSIVLVDGAVYLVRFACDVFPLLYIHRYSLIRWKGISIFFFTYPEVYFDLAENSDTTNYKFRQISLPNMDSFSVKSSVLCCLRKVFQFCLNQLTTSFFFTGVSWCLYVLGIPVSCFLLMRCHSAECHCLGSQYLYLGFNVIIYIYSNCFYYITLHRFAKSGNLFYNWSFITWWNICIS